jgi:hypothetical protein
LLVPNVQTVNPPTTNGVVVDLSNGLDGFMGLDGNGKINLTAEEKALLDGAGLRTAATDDIELYFINKFAPRDRRGEALGASGVPDNKYADSVIIAYEDRTDFVVPHEIGHILLDSGDHYTGSLWPANLMRTAPSALDSETASKRLTPAQQADMLTKRPNLLTGP